MHIHPRHYVCITAHFITSNFIPPNTIISFRQFYGRIFALHLRRHICTVLAMFGLDKGKVHASTTGNGSDMPKPTQMMNIFGVRLHCAAHGMSLVVQKSLNLWLKVNRQKNLTCALASVAKDTDDENNVDDAADLDRDDDSSESDEDAAAPLDLQNIGVLMSKSRKLIKTIRKSSILPDTVVSVSSYLFSVQSLERPRWRRDRERTQGRTYRPICGLCVAAYRHEKCGSVAECHIHRSTCARFVTIRTQNEGRKKSYECREEISEDDIQHSKCISCCICLFEDLSGVECSSSRVPRC